MKKNAQILFLWAFSIGLTAPAEAKKVFVGEHIQYVAATPHPYATSHSNQPTVAWTNTIYHPGSLYVAPYIRRLELAPGDVLVVRSPDAKQKWEYRGFGRRNLGRNGGFFATHIKGDTAVLELYTSGTVPAWGLEISHYGRGYNEDEIRHFWQLGLGEKMRLPAPKDQAKSICGNDDSLEAKCYQRGEPAAYDKARAVVRLLVDGEAHCTGWLLGCDGHFVTNAHCIGSQTKADNIDVEFMAEGGDCSTDCSAQMDCPGTIEASGGTLVAVDPDLDYAMVMPDTSIGGGTDLPKAYGYMQLRASGPVLNERIYIPQHPVGGGKRIAMVSTHQADIDGFARVASLDEAHCGGGHTRDIGYWADTRSNSSGSPVLGYADNLVIALHHCSGQIGCNISSNDYTDHRDPNRAVPVPAMIASLGDALPHCAICNPPGAPMEITATPTADNQIDVTWKPSPGASSHRIYRSVDGCPTTSWTLIASGITAPFFRDTTVSGEVTHAYKVVAVGDTSACVSSDSPCVDAMPSGSCTQAPDFAGIMSAESAYAQTCGVQVSWKQATPRCGQSVRYNVYRDGALLAPCLQDTTYLDTAFIDIGEHTYVVRAEDASGNGTGPCASGNESVNTESLTVQPTGPGVVVFEDDMEAEDTNWSALPGPQDSGGTELWQRLATNAHSLDHSWFVSNQSRVKDQVLMMARSQQISTGGRLEFWHHFDTENAYDGGVLEYSIDNGQTWLDIGSKRFLSGGYNKSLGTGYQNPMPGRRAWSGQNGGFEHVRVDLDDFAGQTLLLRWRLGCDASAAKQGWWLDDVRIVDLKTCQLANK